MRGCRSPAPAQMMGAPGISAGDRGGDVIDGRLADRGSVHRRLPCQCPFRRIRATWGRRHPAWAPTTATSLPRPAYAAATVPVRTAPLVLAGPASAGGGAVRAAVTPDSIRPTPARPDKRTVTWPGSARVIPPASSAQEPQLPPATRPGSIL